MKLFCVSILRLVDEPLMGCPECETCYACPLAYVKAGGQQVKFIDLSEREKADLRQIKLFEREVSHAS